MSAQWWRIQLQPGATPTPTAFLCLAFGEYGVDLNAATAEALLQHRGYASSARSYSSTASPARHPSATLWLSPHYEEGKGLLNSHEVVWYINKYDSLPF